MGAEGERLYFPYQICWAWVDSCLGPERYSLYSSGAERVKSVINENVNYEIMKEVGRRAWRRARKRRNWKNSTRLRPLTSCGDLRLSFGKASGWNWYRPWSACGCIPKVRNEPIRANRCRRRLTWIVQTSRASRVQSGRRTIGDVWRWKKCGSVPGGGRLPCGWAPVAVAVEIEYSWF